MISRTYTLEVSGNGEPYVLRASEVFSLAAAQLHAEAFGGPVVSGSDERYCTPNGSLTRKHPPQIEALTPGQRELWSEP